nr:hypothetical protein [Pedobacter frigoris]
MYIFNAVKGIRKQNNHSSTGKPAMKFPSKYCELKVKEPKRTRTDEFIANNNPDTEEAGTVNFQLPARPGVFFNAMNIDIIRRMKSISR